jgi:hypothetical protein
MWAFVGQVIRAPAGRNPGDSGAGDGLGDQEVDSMLAEEAERLRIAVLDST